MTTLKDLKKAVKKITKEREKLEAFAKDSFSITDPIYLRNKKAVNK